MSGFAGQRLIAALAGAGAGAAALAGGQAVAAAGTPAHSRPGTQEELAKRNMGGMLQTYSKVTPMELATYEGIRQGLMAGEITGEQVNAMAREGEIPDRVMVLLTDVHDWSAHDPLDTPSANYLPKGSAPDIVGYTGA